MPDHLTIDATAFQIRCEQLIDQLERGQLARITVTKHGRIVAELTPSTAAQRR